MYIISPKVKEGDVVLGTYSNGKPAVVMRKTGKYPQVFCGGVDIPTELYRYVCEQTGIYTFTIKIWLWFAQTGRILAYSNLI